MGCVNLTLPLVLSLGFSGPLENTSRERLFMPAIGEGLLEVRKYQFTMQKRRQAWRELLAWFVAENRAILSARDDEAGN